MEKYCVNCKHVVEIPMYSGNGMVFSGGVGPMMRTCRNSSETNLVTGLSEYKHCSEVRKNPTLCGESGEWFEPKDF